MPSIDRNSPVPFYQQVYEQIVHGIESGFYPVGKKLPSIRECARELAVSNTTIELAYQRLTEEGYVQSRRGSGYTICELHTAPAHQLDRYPEEFQRNLQTLVEQEQAQAQSSAPAYDFAYDSIDASTFPFTTWARICREVFFTQGSNDACLYNDPQGLRDLRVQIARYVSAEFGLNCLAEQVLIMPTTRDLVSEITALFDSAKTAVAMGNPGYDEVGRRLNERGYRVLPIPTFPYPNLLQAIKAIEGANVVFVTPASQFPSNHTMPLDLRKALVEWAQDNDAYLIDDEYGWEYQSGMGRLPALAALDDTGHVITMGTFSNTFTPAVCLSYAVLPPQLMLKWKSRKRGSHPQVPWQTQAAMTAFMSEDHWRTHVRKIRTTMKSKRQLLLRSLESYLGNAVEVVEGDSSLFVLVQTTDGRTEDELLRAAESESVRVYPTSQYWHDDPPADWRYVLVGYANTPIDRIEPGVQALARAWGFR